MGEAGTHPQQPHCEVPRGAVAGVGHQVRKGAHEGEVPALDGLLQLLGVHGDALLAVLQADLQTVGRRGGAQGTPPRVSVCACVCACVCVCVCECACVCV